MPMPGRTLTLSLVDRHRWAYQGQERDEETNWEAFELRMWDGRLGRWISTDPAGQYASPYVGMGNNPVSLIDPDGALAGIPEGDGIQEGEGIPEGESGEKVKPPELGLRLQVPLEGIRLVQKNGSSVSLGSALDNFERYGHSRYAPRSMMQGISDARRVPVFGTVPFVDDIITHYGTNNNYTVYVFTNGTYNSISLANADRFNSGQSHSFEFDIEGYKAGKGDDFGKYPEEKAMLENYKLANGLNLTKGARSTQRYGFIFLDPNQSFGTTLTKRQGWAYTTLHEFWGHQNYRIALEGISGAISNPDHDNSSGAWNVMGIAEEILINTVKKYVPK